MGWDYERFPTAGRQTRKSEGPEFGQGKQNLPEIGAVLEPDEAHQQAHVGITADRVTTERDDCGKGEPHRDPEGKKKVSMTIQPTSTK